MNVAIYESRKVAVIAARNIFEKTKHQTRTQVSEQGYLKTIIAIKTHQNVTCVNPLASKVVKEEGMGKCE